MIPIAKRDLTEQLAQWNDLANENPGEFSEDGKPHGAVRQA